MLWALESKIAKMLFIELHRRVCDKHVTLYLHRSEKIDPCSKALPQYEPQLIHGAPEAIHYSNLIPGHPDHRFAQNRGADPSRGEAVTTVS